MKRIIMILDFSEHRNIACCLLATATVFIFFIFFLLLTVTKTLGQEKKETEVTSQTITSIKDKLKHIENRIVEIRKTDWFKLLNDQQKKYVLWDERIFSYAYNPKNYEIGN
ncbi:MAG: hypothetical protein LBU34_03370, partial [Planctomycetaceae bacterium]|nr:hypothetical protein [Planctomycetaceae bacterium]